MSRIYNATKKKLILLTEVESDDARQFKEWLVVEPYASEKYSDGKNRRCVVVDNDFLLYDIMLALRAYCLKLSEIYVAIDENSDDDENVIKCTSVDKITEARPAIKEFIKDYPHDLDDFIRKNNIKRGVMTPFVDADALMTLALPVFENPKRLKQFRSNLRLMVKRLNDRCLLEPAKNLTPKRIKVYDYLEHVYRNYRISIDQGASLDISPFH